MGGWVRGWNEGGVGGDGGLEGRLKRKTGE